MRGVSLHPRCGDARTGRAGVVAQGTAGRWLTLPEATCDAENKGKFRLFALFSRGRMASLNGSLHAN